jgi:ribonuclease R
MRRNDAKSRIVELLQANLETPLTAVDIREALAFRGSAVKRASKWLHELEREGRIACVGTNRYGMGLATDMVTGPIELFRSGDGRVWDERRAESVFIPRRRTGTALPGDTVLVRLEADRPEHRPRKDTVPERTGRVMNVVERARHDVVGTLRSTGKFLYVVPMDPVFKHDLYVPDAAGGALGDRVVARFTNWENVHVSPEGEVIEVLGPADLPSVDTASVMRHYGLPERFPEAAMREAESASALTEAAGPRLDLRGLRVLTIDPERARDYDDALSLESDAAGRRVLGVHIADVAHFIRRGGALEAEAARRGNSVYLPDAVVPMLPEPLSNGICSLKPNEDRLTLSVFLTLDGQGKIVATTFARSVIRSCARLTYERVMAVLSGSDGGGADPLPEAVVSLLVRLSELAQQSRRRRFARHALDLDLPECELTLGPDGMIASVRLVRSDPSHQLVEECMVAANEAVALELHNRRAPAIHRVHEPPAEEKIAELTVTLTQMGYRPGDLRVQRQLAAFLRSVRSDPLAHAVQLAILKSMNRAVYSATALGHYGLAKKFYLHFTSPIRRYPDLLVHRQLRLVLFPEGSERVSVDALAGAPDAGAPPPAEAAGPRLDRRELVAMATHCSETERNAETAERTLVELKKLRLLAAQIERGKPVVYDAVVVRILPFGLFVELDELQVQGLVPSAGLSDRPARFNRRRRTPRTGNRTHEVGARLRVYVTRVDFDRRRIDFALAGPAT